MVCVAWGRREVGGRREVKVRSVDDVGVSVVVAELGVVSEMRDGERWSRFWPWAGRSRVSALVAGVIIVVPACGSPVIPSREEG